MSKMRLMKRRSLRRDAGDAFLPDPASGTFITNDSRAWRDDAESVAEEFITSITSADFVLEDARNEIAMEEIGGPFLEDEELEFPD